MPLLQYTHAIAEEARNSLRLFSELSEALTAPGCMRRLQRQVDQLAGGREQGRRLLTVQQMHTSATVV